MLKKKECKRCGGEISSRYDFCPYCGNRIKSVKDWGMLGRNDALSNDLNMNVGGFMNNMFGSMMKMIEKEMSRDMKRVNSPNMRIVINGKEVDLGNKKQGKLKKIVRFSPEKMQRFADLPKEEAKSSMKRLADRVVYEINMPEVRSVNDVLIIPLESGIEIKALGKKRVYVKRISARNNIINYNLLDGKLVLELKEKK